VIYLGSQGVGIMSDLIRTRLSQKQQMYIRLKIYEHLQKLHLDFFHKKKVGDLLTRLGMDAMAIESFITTLIQTFFISLINFIAIIYISLTLNTKVTLLALAVFPLYILSEHFGLNV